MLTNQTNPNQYIRYTREEIAHLCGFDNVKHFYVVFKQVTGMTTGQYLKQL